MEMDSDFSHDPADLARLLRRARAATPTWRSARATSPAAASTDWGAAAALHQRGRLDLRAAGARAAGPRPDGRLQVLSPRGARSDPLRDGALPRLCLPGRADLPRRAARLPRRRGPDRLPRPPAGPEQDVLADRRRGDVAGAAACASADAGLERASRLEFAPSRPMQVERWMRRRTRSPTACAHTRATLAHVAAAPGSPCVGRWVAGARRSRRPACWRRCWLIAPLDHGYHADHQLRPAFRRRRRSATSLHVLRATCSCSRCTRWPASPASSPARRCRCRPSVTTASRAGCTNTAGRLAIAFVDLRDDVLAERAGLPDRAHARRARRLPAGLAGAAAARRAAARAPRADRAVPAARRVDHRQPPRRVGRSCSRRRS